MYFYIQDNQYALRASNRDAMIQKIINAIHLVNATPKANRQSAIDAMADPNLSVSLTDEPKWTLRFHEISFWVINQQLRIREIGEFAISIRLPDGLWLNCRANINKKILVSQLLLISLELIMAAAIMISAWSIHTFTKPLSRFKSAADRLGVDIQAKPLLEYGPSIVRETADAMNKMQQRIHDLINDRTKMLAAISHDLRTPITRMKLRTQFIEEQELHNKNIKDLNEMEVMISQILAFAKQDPMKETPRNLDLFSLLATICDDTADMGHQVNLTSEHYRIPFYGRPISLKRAFTNLINNAVKYANNVQVAIQKRSRSAIVTIEDDGPGIPEKDLMNVFKPFYRGEHSRSRDTGGVGLGLAVTRDIIRAHSGRVLMSNRPEGGLKVTVILPLGKGA